MSLGELTDATVRYLYATTWAYLDVEPELTTAVTTDCLRTVADAYSPDLGD